MFAICSSLLPDPSLLAGRVIVRRVARCHLRRDRPDHRRIRHGGRGAGLHYVYAGNLLSEVGDLENAGLGAVRAFTMECQDLLRRLTLENRCFGVLTIVLQSRGSRCHGHVGLRDSPSFSIRCISSNRGAMKLQ
jgi:hypothetical protein